MSIRSKEVTDYINKAAAFAQPILKHWRKRVFEASDDIEESLKYGTPHYHYKGDYMLAMAAYSKHCSFTFFKSDFMSDDRLKQNKQHKPIDRFLGKISSLEELPTDKEFDKFLKEAIRLNEQGLKVPRTKKESPKELDMPDYFTKRLQSNKAALSIFETKSPSFRKSYIQWITDAKTDDTRNKRLDQAMEWIAEGKDRFWKFKK
mgnify:CR=1 FL=1